MRARILLLATATVTAVLAVPAGAGAIREVTANGDILFASKLAFAPRSITVPLGETVRWRNTDFLVPHTATENHGLWDLAGNYGKTPFNPAGFAPGTTVQRRFEAGTQNYYCRVHPTYMHGTIAVAPTVRIVTVKRRVRVKRRRGHRRRTKIVRVRVVEVTWSLTAPAAGEGFDAQRRRPGGAWRPLATGTTALGGRFDAGRRGTRWEVRARLRRLSSTTAATGWSPVVTVG